MDYYSGFKTPFASLTNSVLWDFNGAPGLSMMDFPIGQSGGQIAIYLANPPVPPSGLANPMAIKAPFSGTLSRFVTPSAWQKIVI